MAKLSNIVEIADLKAHSYFHTIYLWNGVEQIQWGPHFKYDYFGGHGLKGLGTVSLSELAASWFLLSRFWIMSKSKAQNTRLH